ncbi:MAG: hypothetical protein ACPGVT_12500 [Maricaulaceae bacterium]
MAETLSDAKEAFDVATGRNDATKSADDQGANEAGREFGSDGDAGVCFVSCESYVQDNVNPNFSADPPELPEPDLDERN